MNNRFSAIPQGGLKDLTEARIQTMYDHAQGTLATFQRKIQKLAELMMTESEKYAQQEKEMVASAPNEDKGVIKPVAQRQKVNQILQLRKKLVESSESERQELLRTLKAIYDEAELFAKVHASPVIFLSKIGLGDPEKTNLIQQLEGAGPIELENLAHQAILTNNVKLASAIIVAVDRSPNKKQNFHPQELAERVVGEQFNRIKNKLDSIRHAFNLAMAANREFVAGKDDPNRQLALALADKALAEVE